MTYLCPLNIVNQYFFMKQIARFRHLLWSAATIFAVGLAVSCTEEISTDDRFTASDYTIMSFLEHSDSAYRYTEYASLLHQVSISEQSNSTVAQLLATRGAYTCFAPNNKAIYDYLDSLYKKGIISEPSWNGFRSEATLDSVRKVIVYNSVLDGSNIDKVLEMGDILSQNDEDEFTLPNLNDRKLYKTHVDQTDSIFINGHALIDLRNRDVKTLNGRVHEVHAVIAPSNDTMADMFRQIVAENEKGFVVMAKLILACGLEDTLSKTQDDEWEYRYKNQIVKDLPVHSTGEGIGPIPDHRKYGFTIFSETDDFWEQTLAAEGIHKSYNEIEAADIVNFLIQKGAYPHARQDNDFKNEENILNQFVTYHILPEKLTPEKLVIHYNENGYCWSTTEGRYTVPVYEYFTTMGKRRLLKIYQSKESAEEDDERSDGNAGIYLNRFPILRNGRGMFSDESIYSNNDYHESGMFKDPGTYAYIYPDENRGVKVRFEAEDAARHTKLLNSCIYPIERLLVYTENIQNRFAGERIRINMAAMFPEMINNELRRPMGKYSFSPADHPTGGTVGFPVEYNYLADVSMHQGTGFYYLSGYNRQWSNYQGDEFNIIGKYEFTMKLPPVPKRGHYEVRFGVSSNSKIRSMCQVYFGDNPNYLPAKDIPMDLRIGFVQHRFKNADQTSTFGYTSVADYEADAKLSMEEQDEINKALRARGFMKGPRYFHCRQNTDASNLAYLQPHVTRRIMVSEDMDPDKEYYIRFKNVLDDESLQFFMDYFEFVSKEVYDNPVEPEDMW